MSIGSLYRNIVGNYHNGNIYLVNIYNRPLTQSEVIDNNDFYKWRFRDHILDTPPVPVTLISDWNPENGVYTDAGSTLAVHGQTVEEWHDQSTNNLIARQTSISDKPTYLSGATINKACVEFDGTNTWLEVIGSEALYGDADITIYIVLEIDTATNYDTIFQKGEDWNWDSGWLVSMDGAARSSATIFEWSQNEFTHTAGSTGTVEVRSMRFRTSSAPKISNLSVDGDPDTEITLNASHETNDAPNHNAIIGASWNSTGTDHYYELDGKIYRILIYNVYHDDTTYANNISSLITEYS
jgi:hypothetical protein